MTWVAVVTTLKSIQYLQEPQRCLLTKLVAGIQGYSNFRKCYFQADFLLKTKMSPYCFVRTLMVEIAGSQFRVDFGE